MDYFLFDEHTVLFHSLPLFTIELCYFSSTTWKMIVFKYQLLHIGSGKRQIIDTLHAVQPDIKRYITSMESSLEMLNQQEEKYTAELDVARQAIRTDKELEAAQRLQATYGKKFDHGMLAQSRKDVAEMLDEPAEPVSIRQTLQQLRGRHNRKSHEKKRIQER